MSKGFLDNLFSAILGPKGNMADWQHASRLYVDGNQRLAPKTKYLYHVYFQLDPIVESILPELKTKHNLEIGMLVKSADLPRYTAIVETKNKYNRKKNVQTGIQYQPINISFHDDNYGVTTALLEAYYRYYYADAGYGRVPGAYNKAGAGDNTYMGSNRNQYKYGLDNDISVPFFQNIQITQLAKKTFTTYRIVNPIITDWQHDTVDNSVSDMMTNNITVAYEAVHYERGVIEAGSQNNPTGFGSQEHYDKQPSPISLLGGGQLGVGATLGAATDIYDYISKGTKFNSPLEAGLGAFQLVRNLQNLNLRDLQNEIIDIAPLSHIRGRSFNDSVIIVDEAQNATIHELKTVITRTGKNSKIVLLGDTEQVDIPYVDKFSNGLTIVVEKLKNTNLTGHVTFTKGYRSELANVASKLL